MKSTFGTSLLTSVLPPLLGLSLALAAPSAHAEDPVDDVDPNIGNVGVLLEPTRPTVSLPNSMIRVYPVRHDGLEDELHSFPLTIISHRLGELFYLMPDDGDPGSWTEGRGSDDEHCTPYYYSVRLDKSQIQSEFTPTARCGYFRFTFPSGKAVIHLANRQGGDMTAEGQNAFSGVEDFSGMKAYVYGEFSRPVSIERTTAGRNQARLTATAADPGKELEVRYGISFISVEQAKKNLSEEIPSWDFDGIKRKARNVWNDRLGQVRVEGGTPAQRRVFYTALYRCCERMVSITEDGQYYSGYDHAMHQDARPFYVDNWMWDLYHALEPLQTLLQPKMEADKIQSYVRMYQQTGWMPSFAVLWGPYPCMTCNHAAAWFADAYFKGVTNFDAAEAYAGVKKNSLQRTFAPWKITPAGPLDTFYDEHGYFPAIPDTETEPLPEYVHSWEKRQAIAVTTGHSFDDWDTAQLARALGHNDDYDLFLKRAGYYKNLYRADKGFMWPKDDKGNWIEPFDPKWSGGQGGRYYTTENSVYIYNWDVDHDLTGLIALMGGPQAAAQKLDELFHVDLGRSKYEYYAKFPDSTGLVGQFVMGNEPSLSIPYIYNHVGEPWQTQKRVRELLDYWFTDTHFGIPGDEDGGGLSAFVVFSMMGFYPVIPGVPTYELGSPIFERVTIKLQNGKTLRINAKNASVDNKYITSVRFNGQPQQKVWFKHSDVVNGLTVDLNMADAPDTTLGAASDSLPPSSMDLDPRTLQ